MKKNKVQKNIWFDREIAENLERQAKEMDIPFSSFVKFKLFGGKENGNK